MLVKELMSTKLITVGFDDKLTTVKEIFDNAKIHHLLVVESNQVCGVISDLDLYKALSPDIGKMIETVKDASTLNKRAHQIMTRHPVTLGLSANIDEAINIFNTHAISCIPVIDHEQKPLGIITLSDILKALSERKLALE